MWTLVGCGVIFLGLMVWLFQVGMALMDAKKAGLLDEEKTDKYQVSRENNLTAIHKALLQAADSDGGFPAADKWMDTAVLRLKTGDLSEAEAREKLKVPGGTEGYGYAFNKALGGKHPDDFKDKGKTVIVYESVATQWNASGDPLKDARPKAKGVTLQGDVVDVGR